MIRKVLYNISALFLLSILMSTSCQYGFFFESKLPPNSTYVIYGLRRVDDKRDSLGIASTEQFDDSVIVGRSKFARGRKEMKRYVEKYDSVKIVVLPDSLYWKFGILDTKTIEGAGLKWDRP